MAPPTPQTLLYFGEGQSNMGTLGNSVDQLATGETGAFTGQKIFDNTNDAVPASATMGLVAYVIARTGQTFGAITGPQGERTVAGSDAAPVGPMVGLALALRDDGFMSGLSAETWYFKVSAAGKRISYFQAYGDTASYDAADADRRIGYQYRQLAFRALRTSLTTAPAPVKLQAMIHWQGEANTNNARTALNTSHVEITSYPSEFAKVYADWNAQLGVTPPWFVIQLLPIWNDAAAARDVYQDAMNVVRKGMCRWTVNMPGGVFTNITDNGSGDAKLYFVQHDYTTKLDTTQTDPHVTAVQQKEIGKAISKALIAINGGVGYAGSYPLTQVLPLVSGVAATVNSTTVTATGFVSDTCTAYAAAVPTGTVPTAAQVVAGTGGGITVAANAAVTSATPGVGFSIALNSLAVGTHDIYCCIKLSTGETSTVRAATGLTVTLVQTWDETYQPVALTYTSGNLKVANLSGSTYYARGKPPASGNGKYYFEALITGAGSPPVFIGIGENDAATGGGTAGTNRSGWAGSTLVSTGTPGTNITMTGNVAVNDVISVCWDETAQKLWMRRNNTGTWNNNSADPVAGTGSAGISGMNMAKLVPMAGLGINDEVTLRLAPGSWSYSPPTGFGQML